MLDQRSPALEAGGGKRLTAPTLDELRDQLEAVLAELDVLQAMVALFPHGGTTHG